MTPTNTETLEQIRKKLEPIHDALTQPMAEAKALDENRAMYNQATNVIVLAEKVAEKATATAEALQEAVTPPHGGAI